MPSTIATVPPTSTPRRPAVSSVPASSEKTSAGEVTQRASSARLPASTGRPPSHQPTATTAKTGTIVPRTTSIAGSILGWKVLIFR